MPILNSPRASGIFTVLLKDGKFSYEAATGYSPPVITSPGAATMRDGTTDRAGTKVLFKSSMSENWSRGVPIPMHAYVAGA